MQDEAGLGRFLVAQDPVYARVLAELGAGAKRSHWMWFVFPQLEGLGVSPMARRYAIRSLAEARAYLGHPVLGARLLECTGLVRQAGLPLARVFGAPDDLKFRSCMTLFACASSDPAPFVTALEQLCGGVGDPRTLAALGR